MSDLLRPAWLTDDTNWREQLHAMPDDEVRWFEHQWKTAGGPPPDIDVSWIKMESIRG